MSIKISGFTSQQKKTVTFIDTFEGAAPEEWYQTDEPVEDITVKFTETYFPRIAIIPIKVLTDDGWAEPFDGVMREVYISIENYQTDDSNMCVSTIEYADASRKKYDSETGILINLDNDPESLYTVTEYEYVEYNSKKSFDNYTVSYGHDTSSGDYLIVTDSMDRVYDYSYIFDSFESFGTSFTVYGCDLGIIIYADTRSPSPSGNFEVQTTSAIVIYFPENTRIDVEGQIFE